MPGREVRLCHKQPSKNYRDPNTGKGSQFKTSLGTFSGATAAAVTAAQHSQQLSSQGTGLGRIGRRDRGTRAAVGVPAARTSLGNCQDTQCTHSHSIFRIPPADPVALQCLGVWDSPRGISPCSSACHSPVPQGAWPATPSQPREQCHGLLRGLTEPTCWSVPSHLHPQSPPGFRVGVQANSTLSHWNSRFQ